MRALIDRPDYMEQLISFRKKQIIKVVTGIHRCGKSTLFDLYCEHLRNNGVQEDQIIRINLEDPDYHDIQDYMQLYDLVKDRLNQEKMSYNVFLQVRKTWRSPPVTFSATLHHGRIPRHLQETCHTHGSRLVMKPFGWT